MLVQEKSILTFRDSELKNKMFNNSNLKNFITNKNNSSRKLKFEEKVFCKEQHFNYNKKKLIRLERNNMQRRSCNCLLIRNCLSFSSKVSSFYILSSFITLTILLQLTTIRWLQQVEAIKLQPEGKEKFYWSGDQFVITCQNNNNIKNVKIRWIGPNGSDITEDRSQKVHAESTGPHGHRLVFMDAIESIYDGQYKCTLGSTDDKNPREYTVFNLKIFKSTNFKDTAKHLVLGSGKRGVMNCHVDFDPSVLSATVTWYRDFTPIDLLNDPSYEVAEYDPARQSSSLIINPVRKSNAGNYTCRAMAVTSKLSKISDHNIELEIKYAPTFDQPAQTVWVEKSSSILNRQQQQLLSGNIYTTSTATNSQTSGRPSIGSGSSYQKHRHHQQQQQQHSSDNYADNNNNNNNQSQIVRVELRCSCQSNPPASIIWESTDNTGFVLTKGNPMHVLEEPRIEQEGHNTTSYLVIGYNLQLDWPNRRTSYICSATNIEGKATKTFTIEQGDPPPAFNVGQQKSYNSQTSMFKFTLLGPNLDPDSPASSQMSSYNSNSNPNLNEINPPVDSFRIRAETVSSSNVAGNSNSGSNQQASRYWSSKGRHLGGSVQWNLSASNHQQQQQAKEVASSNFFSQQQQQQPSQAQLILPQTFNISLAKLPSGNQKLFLEAHNAVGWSPNSTYLGDYYIVSGATSLSKTMNFTYAYVFVILCSVLIVSLYQTNNQQFRKRIG